MSVPGDIPIVGGDRPLPDAATGGLVWLEDGKERPFNDDDEQRRTWLEDSSDWVGDRPAKQKEDDKGEGLVWI